MGYKDAANKKKGWKKIWNLYILKNTHHGCGHEKLYMVRLISNSRLCISFLFIGTENNSQQVNSLTADKSKTKTLKERWMSAVTSADNLDFMLNSLSSSVSSILCLFWWQSQFNTLLSAQPSHLFLPLQCKWVPLTLPFAVLKLFEELPWKILIKIMQV